MTRQQLFALCFFGVLLVLLYQIVVIFSPFLVPILWAAILVRLSYPLHARLTVFLRGRDTISATALTAAVILLAVLPVVYMGVLLVQESVSAYESATTWIQSDGMKRLPEYLSRLPRGGTLQELMGRAVVTNVHLEDAFLQGTKTLSVYLLSQVGDLAKNAFNLVMSFLVMIFTLFFFFKDGHRLYETFYRLIPLEETHKHQIVTRLDMTLTAVMRGIVVTAIAQGLLAGTAYWFLDVPFPIILTCLTALLSLLPFGGTALVWVPVAIYLFTVGPLWAGIVMLVWGVVVVTMADNFLKPLLIGKGAGIPTLFLFFGILGGLAAYGFIGLFLGPILIAILFTAVQIYREEYQDEQAPFKAKSEDPPQRS